MPPFYPPLPDGAADPRRPGPHVARFIDGGTTDEGAADLQHDVATDASAPGAALRDLAVAHSRLGDMRAASGETAQAVEKHRLALAVMQAVSACAPAAGRG